MSDEQLSRNMRALEVDEEPNPAFADALFAQLEDEVVAKRGPGATWLLLAAAALIAALAVGAVLGSGLVQLPLLIAEASPTATPLPTASARASASPTAPPSATPTAEPTPIRCDALAPDCLARVWVDGLSLRADPGLDGDKLGELSEITPAFLVRGPMAEDGYDWYEIAGIGSTETACAAAVADPITCPTWFGWAAGGDIDGTPWLRWDDVNCHESPMNLEALAAYDWNERLRCYAGGTVTVWAWWPGQAEERDCLAPTSNSARWLYCVGLYGVPLWSDESDPASGLGSAGLLASIDPGSGVTMPASDQWVEVIGHFDDPSAAGCPEVAQVEAGTTAADEVVLQCRAQLVVDSVTGQGPV